MRNAISEYIGMTDEEKSELWKECTFIFDTNILLNLYRYTKKTRDSLLKSMSNLQGRVWMPYQVAYEFMKDRADVVFETINNYDELKADAKNFVKKCSDLLRIKNEEKEIAKLEKQIIEWIDNVRAKNLVVNKLENDSILQEILKLFEGKTGAQCVELEEIKKQGEERYKKQIPPGYKDAIKSDGKHDNNCYGDYIVWTQIMDYAQNNKKDIIYITNDQKEDWWERHKGKTIGPRVELIKEFRDKTQQKFYMYTMEQFLKVIEEKQGKKVDDSVIEEVNQMPIRRKRSLFPMLDKRMDRIQIIEKEIIDRQQKIYYLRNESFEIEKYISKLLEKYGREPLDKEIMVRLNEMHYRKENIDKHINDIEIEISKMQQEKNYLVHYHED